MKHRSSKLCVRQLIVVENPLGIAARVGNGDPTGRPFSARFSSVFLVVNPTHTMSKIEIYHKDSHKPHTQMRTMVLEYLPTFTYSYLKKGPTVGKYSSTMVRIWDILASSAELSFCTNIASSEVERTGAPPKRRPSFNWAPLDFHSRGKFYGLVPILQTLLSRR